MKMLRLSRREGSPLLSEGQDALDLQALLSIGAGKTQPFHFTPVLGHSSGAGRMRSLQAKDFPQTHIEKRVFSSNYSECQRLLTEDSRKLMIEDDFSLCDLSLYPASKMNYRSHHPTQHFLVALLGSLTHC